MIERSIEPELKTLSKEFPIVAVLGLRKSGKITIAKPIFNDYKNVSFENMDNRTFFSVEDPSRFNSGEQCFNEKY